MDVPWPHATTELPDDLTIISGNKQSAVGFSPNAAPAVTPGQDFLLGLMWHANNPIYGANQYFSGDMGVRLALDSQTVTYTFGWTLNETPNNASPSTNPLNNDILTFSNTTGTQVVTIGGIDYQLILKGFKDNGYADIGVHTEGLPCDRAGQPGHPVHHGRDQADHRVPVCGARAGPSAEDQEGQGRRHRPRRHLQLHL